MAIEAVADVPDVGIEAFATGNVNEVRLVVTATQTDDSGSEFIRNIIASELPAGVTLTPASIATPTGEPDEFVQEYILTLPMDQDTDFDLTFTATSVEESNLDSETGALLTDAFFNTVGPSGSYTLDFIWGILLQAYASIDVDFGSINFDPLGIIPGDQTVDLGGIDETVNFPAIDIGPGSVNVIDIDSSDLGGSFTFPAPADSLSVDFAWPNIETTSGAAVDPATSSGESENFLQLNLDIDQLVTQLAGLPVNPFNPGTDIAGGACLRRT